MMIWYADDAIRCDDDMYLGRETGTDFMESNFYAKFIKKTAKNNNKKINEMIKLLCANRLKDYFFCVFHHFLVVFRSSCYYQPISDTYLFIVPILFMSNILLLDFFISFPFAYWFVLFYFVGKLVIQRKISSQKPIPNRYHKYFKDLKMLISTNLKRTLEKNGFSHPI